MSDPVSASQSAPLFGGLSGYRRPTPGKPTSVPGGLPAFRGRNNTPGSTVAAPSIRTSYNRQDKGTNVCIPYARVVPLDHLRNVGRVSPGDVAFCSRFTMSLGHAQATETRVVGLDYLNRELGGRPEYDARESGGPGKYVENWAIGHNVLLGAGASASLTPFVVGNPGIDDLDPGDIIADNWRSLALLREWACDGVVLSNDEPHCFQSGGDHDGQIFNIAVQGVCALNNGYGTHATPPLTHVLARSTLPPEYDALCCCGHC